MRIVERDEGLQRCVRAFAPHARGLAARGVENVQRRRRRGALPERVEAATVERLATVAFVIARGAPRHGDGLPDPLGLVGLHARAADLSDEKPTGREGGIADHLTVHPETRAAREQAVRRVALDLCARGGRALPVGRAGDDEFHQPLHVPAALAEFDGEPVEKLGVRWSVAHDAEILGRFDESGAENFLPEAVHRHARGERVCGRDKPLREAETVQRRVFGERMQCCEHGGLQLVLRLVVLAAGQQACHRLGARLFHLHMGDRAAILDCGPLAIQRRNPGGVPGEGGVVATVKLKQLLPFRRRARRAFREQRDGFRLAREVARLGRRERPRIDPHILHVAGEELALLALADAKCDIRSEAALQRVDLHLRLVRLAVDENAHARGLARAVVGHEHMPPLAGLRMLARRAHLDRALRKFLDEMNLELAALRLEIPAAMRGSGPVHPREHAARALGVRRHPHPGGRCERPVALEIRHIAGVQRDAL